MPIVTLSDGQPCNVRQLGLFELDGKGREVLGVYRYQLLLATGIIVEDSYDIRALTYTPSRPNVPIDQIKPGSTEWKQLEDYETYLAALAHEQLRIESYEGYVNDIALYILDNCIEPSARNRIQEDDWKIITRVALVPQLNEEGLAECLAQTFQGYL